jgi:hypothetical protein
MRTKDQMAAAEGLAYKEGWHIRWSPAIDSPNHSKYAVAGAAVLVKIGYGLFDLPDVPSDVYTGFVAAGLVELFAGLPFMAYSTYLECGLGLAGRNCEIMKAIGAHIRGHGLLFVIGGDFNVPPQEMSESIWPESFGGVIVTGHTQYTTASAGKTGRQIDYFIVHKDLAKIGLHGRTAFDVPVRTHLGVALSFPRRPSAFVQTEIVKPAR